MHSGSHHPCKSFHHSQTGLVLTLELKKRKNLESRFRVVITRRRIYGQMVAFQWVQQASNAMTSLSKGQIWCLFHLIGHLPALLLKLTICLQKNVKPKTSLVTQWYKITKNISFFQKLNFLSFADFDQNFRLYHEKIGTFYHNRENAI